LSPSVSLSPRSWRRGQQGRRRGSKPHGHDQRDADDSGAAHKRTLQAPDLRQPCQSQCRHSHSHRRQWTNRNRRLTAQSARTSCRVNANDAGSKPGKCPAELERRAGDLSPPWHSRPARPGSGARRRGERGAARVVARLLAKVEERIGDAPGTAAQIAARLTAALPGRHVRPLMSTCGLPFRLESPGCSRSSSTLISGRQRTRWTRAECQSGFAGSAKKD
jgi:hypothetical protein